MPSRYSGDAPNAALNPSPAPVRPPQGRPIARNGAEVSMAVDDTTITAPAPFGWRFTAGVGLFALMALLWLLIPIDAALGMSAGTIAATTAGIAIANKVILLIAIAVMGKA